MYDDQIRGYEFFNGFFIIFIYAVSIIRTTDSTLALYNSPQPFAVASVYVWFTYAATYLIKIYSTALLQYLIGYLFSNFILIRSPIVMYALRGSAIIWK